MSKLYSGAEIVFKCLEDQDVEFIFGYPGGAVLPIYDELKNHKKIKSPIFFRKIIFSISKNILLRAKKTFFDENFHIFENFEIFEIFENFRQKKIFARKNIFFEMKKNMFKKIFYNKNKSPKLIQ